VQLEDVRKQVAVCVDPFDHGVDEEHEEFRATLGRGTLEMVLAQPV
jgi:hypothetical protein